MQEYKPALHMKYTKDEYFASKEDKDNKCYISENLSRRDYREKNDKATKIWWLRYKQIIDL